MEDEAIAKLPDCQESFDVCRDEYRALLLEAHYRIAMLKVLNSEYNNAIGSNENPFEQYSTQKQHCIGLLKSDIETLSARIEEFKNSCADGIKTSSEYSTILKNAEKLNARMDSFCNNDEDSSGSTDKNSDELSKEYFFNITSQYARLCILLNQLEYDIVLDSTDKAVREDAEKRLSGKESFEDFKTKLSEIESFNDAFNYQLNYARRIGLVSDENLINLMSVKKCKEMGVVSMFNKAEDEGQDIVVFPPYYYGEFPEFKVYTRCKLMKSHELGELFRKMTEKRGNNSRFLTKFPERYVGLYRECLNDVGVADSEIQKHMSYTYDEETGVYNFYADRNSGILYDSQKLIDNSRNADRKTGHFLWKDIDNEGFWKCVYLSVRVYGGRDMVSVLQDLHDANINYYLECDDECSWNPFVTIYYDPSCVKEALRLFKKYDYLGYPEYIRPETPFREALENGWLRPEEPEGQRETE